MNYLLKHKGILIVGFFLLLTILFFYQVFLGKIPVPADLIVGAYYPWVDYKWGYDVGVPVKNALMSDVVSLMYPWRLLAINYVQSGQFPLWDPTSFLGTTLIGNFQAGIFNPFNLLFFLPVNFNFIWGLQVMIQHLIAMVSMFLLLRQWKLSNLSSVFGAIAYGFSAPMIVWSEYNVHGFSIAVFPLYIYFIDRYLALNNYLNLLGISLLTAFLIFAGYPQYLYYFVFFGFLYFWGKQILEHSNQNEYIKKTVVFSLFIFLGLTLSGVQLIPGMEALANSIRGLDKVASNNSVIFLPLQNLITALIPDFFGNPATNNYSGVGYYESFAFYTSLVALLFIPYAFTFKKRFTIAILITSFTLLSIILAIKSPISEGIQQLSWLGLKGSVSSRILFVYAFGISALSALGLENFIKFHLDDKKRMPFWQHISLKNVWLFAAMTGLATGTVSSYILYKHSGVFNQIDFNTVNTSLRNVVWPTAIALLGSMLIFFIIRFRNKGLVSVIVLLLIVDTFRFGWKYLPFTSNDLIFPQTPVLTYLKDTQRPFRVTVEKGEILTANTWSVYSLESPTGYNIFLPKATARFLSYLNSDHDNKEYARFIDIENLQSKLLPLTNSNYILALKRKDGVPDKDGALSYKLEPLQLSEVFHDGPVVLLKNTNSVDRVFTVDHVVSMQNENQLYSYMLSNNFDPRNEVVLSGESVNSKLTKCNIVINKYTGQYYDISSDCSGNSILVVVTAYHPGWQASVNNKAEKVYKADGNFMAIPLSQGKSTISLQFFPTSFVYGLILSLVSIVVVTTLTVVKLYKR